jgi:hypothetical protein
MKTITNNIRKWNKQYKDESVKKKRWKKISVRS